jgi:hypothetical protein
LSILADAENAETTAFRIQYDVDLVQPLLVFAEHFGDPADREDVADTSQGQPDWPARWAYASFKEAVRRVFLFGLLGDAPQKSASQACGSISFILAVTIRLYITAARSPPRLEPQNNQYFLPAAIPRTPRSAALLDGQMRPLSRKR